MNSYNIGSWYIKKMFNDSPKLISQNFVNTLIDIINELYKSELLIPEYYIFNGKKIIKGINFLSEKYWHSILDKNLNDFIEFKICGTSKVYQEDILVTQDNAVSLCIHSPLLLDIESDLFNGISMELEILVDNFLPYFIINKLEINPDYHNNQQKLTGLLNTLAVDFNISSNEELSIGSIDGFSLKCIVDNNEILTYDNYGKLIGWKSINDF